jgi:hypothetical protein
MSPTAFSVSSWIKPDKTGRSAARSVRIFSVTFAARDSIGILVVMDLIRLVSSRWMMHALNSTIAFLIEFKKRVFSINWTVPVFTRMLS